MAKSIRILLAVAPPLLSLVVAAILVGIGIGENGVLSETFSSSPALKITGLIVLLTHITITAMSLSFHRMHTHRGVTLHPIVDGLMQVWLWATTSMCKLDWVSIHYFHHVTSDTDRDPHSPFQKGLARIFFFGVYDYVVAKDLPEVLNIRNKLKETKLERFMRINHLLGPIVTATTYLVLFGPMYGTLLSVLTFAISPIFAVGGVNAIAHYIGYRNHVTTDNSRNVGFLFPLNWMICGELDHNNHHAHPKSASFSHRWYEFDVGYFYLRLLSLVRLAKIHTIYRAPNQGDTQPIETAVA